jgi:hypothetical protein
MIKEDAIMRRSCSGAARILLQEEEGSSGIDILGFEDSAAAAASSEFSSSTMIEDIISPHPSFQHFPFCCNIR